MTTTCLPPEAYVHLNTNLGSGHPRFREPVNHEIQSLFNDLDIRIATQREWEAAYVLFFGQQAFEDEFPLIEWNDPHSWGSEAAKFRDAFTLADQFVFSVMHRLYPYQQRELIPALTHTLLSWSARRNTSIPASLSEHKVIGFLDWSSDYTNMAEWLIEQK